MDDEFSRLPKPARMEIPYKGPPDLLMPDDKNCEPESPADCPPSDSYPRLVERFVAAGEDPRQFRELYDRLYAEWQPYGISEWFSFTVILRCNWNFRRLDAMEA